MTRTVLFPFLLVGLLFAFGCSSGNQPLSGKVTFSDDDSPVPLGTVYFNSPTSFSQGEIKSDGTYVVGTNKLTDGIPKGTYSVTVQSDEITQIDSPDGSWTTKTTSLIDPRYNNAETSELTFTADGKMRTFNIQVERAPQK